MFGFPAKQKDNSEPSTSEYDSAMENNNQNNTRNMTNQLQVGDSSSSSSTSNPRVMTSFNAFNPPPRTVTTENFRDWRGVMRRPMLVDHIKPHRRRLSLILLDNASIHHCHEFVQRIVAIPGASVRYIPPYCHFLSPLDNFAFRALVQWLQRNHDYVQRVGIQRALESAFHDLNADGGRLARACFRECRYM